MKHSRSFSFIPKLRLPAALLLAMGAFSCGSDPAKKPDPTPEPTAYTLSVPSNFPPPAAQPANNPLTVEGVELGRHLFYETALSVNNSISCASCHRQELAFTDGQARALGVNGARHARSSMALQNLLWEDKLTWDGASATLEQQARVPLENPVEMHLPLTAGVARLQGMPKYVEMFGKAFRGQGVTEENTLRALAQFERTLVSGNSRFDRYMRGERTLLSSDELRGMLLFSTHPNGRVRGASCNDCHAGDLQTDREFRNNALDATLTDLGLGAVTGRATDNGKFRVPSLRNIELTAPYMHDGRFATLEQVVDHYSDHIVRNSPNADPIVLNHTNDPAQTPGTNLALTPTEKRQVVAFLKTLTDTAFVRDKRFARP